MLVEYPYHFDGRHRTAEANPAAHVRQLIEQLLFTQPGERVNRPDFGCGLLQLAFAPNSDALAAAVQATVQGSLQQWLGELIEVEAVEIEHPDAQLKVSVQYIVRRDRDRQLATFTRGLG